MADYNTVLFSSISYRRNIKDMPFVKMLTDTELAVGVARSMSEIFGDEFNFKSLKNMPLKDCLILKEENIISDELISNKDISAFGENDEKSKYIYVNEQDHIRLVAKSKGFELESCFKSANEMDDAILEKLEVCFDVNLGYLTSNPKLLGTGMEICEWLFIPALVKSNMLEKIKRELLKDEYELLSFDLKSYDQQSPFVVIKNKYTLGYKENEFAQKMQKIIQKITELEVIEEDKIFDLSSSGLVDEIYRSFGELWGCYRIGLAEANQRIGQMLWGIRLGILKCKKTADIFALLNVIKENHIGANLSIKEQEKSRARIINKFVIENITKGEVDV